MPEIYWEEIAEKLKIPCENLGDNAEQRLANNIQKDKQNRITLIVIFLDLHTSFKIMEPVLIFKAELIIFTRDKNTYDVVDFDSP